MNELGFEIYGKQYPIPTRFRMGDPVLVREVTGMSWPDFIAALETMEADQTEDSVCIAGLMAVSFWQANPQMSRDKIRRFIERLWQEDASLVGGEEDDSDGNGAVDVSPPESGGEKPPWPSPE